VDKKYAVPLKEAVTGVLHGRAGTFRILIDEQTSGTKHFSLLVNTLNAGVVGDEHKHDVEHCWYILSGKGTIIIDGKSYRVEPDMAVFAPADTLHKIIVDKEQDLTAVVIYAPPGPEQKLRTLGEHAFDATR
jgi:mannose-6-phosphate isomerase-like protein (cupin superfamily)